MNKNFLTYEGDRNKKQRDLYQAILRAAFGPNTDVLCVHHVTFTREGEEPNEIPAADTLIFDHDIMSRVFDDDYLDVIQACAITPCDRRDDVLRELLRMYRPEMLTG